MPDKYTTSHTPSSRGKQLNFFALLKRAFHDFYPRLGNRYTATVATLYSVCLIKLPTRLRIIKLICRAKSIGLKSFPESVSLAPIRMFGFPQNYHYYTFSTMSMVLR